MVEGDLYEIANPLAHFFKRDTVGWFVFSETRRESNVLFLYVGRNSLYATFLVQGELIDISKSYVRHLRVVKKQKNLS